MQAEANVNTLTLGVDLGGTKVETALVDGKGRIIATKRSLTNTAQGPDNAIARVVECAKGCLAEAGSSAFALGVGMAGQIERGTGVVRFAPNLGWRDVPLKDKLEKAMGIPVFITNDVRAITYGEWLYGAGRGFDDLVCVFVGTGVGGGIVSGGRLMEGCGNTAGEIGHLTVVAGGRQCTCRNKGCLEAYAGGWGIAERAREAVHRNEKAGEMLLELAGTYEAITAKTVTIAYNGGDKLARELVSETGNYLAAGLVSIINAFNPCLLILGGGVMEGLPQLMSIVEPIIHRHALEAALKNLQIVSAGLGSKAGVIGAAGLAREMLTG